MRTRHMLVRTAAVLVMLFTGAVAATPPAAAFSFAIDVTGAGVTGSGSIVFPSDSGSDPTGVDLFLDATLFGNAVTFTEADIQTVDWTGADPSDLVDLVVNNLALAVVLGSGDTFLLSDNGGGLGDGLCIDNSDPFTACGGVAIAPAETTWTYTPRVTAQVAGPSTALTLLAGLAVLATRRMRRGGARTRS